MTELFLDKGGVFAEDWPGPTSDQYFSDFDNTMETNQRKSAGGNKLEEDCKSIGGQGCKSKWLDMLEK